MEELTNLLKTLNDISPISAKEKETSLENFSRKTSKYIFFIIGTLFLILLLLIAWKVFLPPLPEVMRLLALVIILSTILLPFAYIVMDIVIGAITIFKFKSHSIDWLLLEIRHDKKNIETLTSYKKVTLEEAQQWLQLKCTRMRNRVSTFIGNADKYAVFSLAGLGWSVWKEFSEKTSISMLSLTKGDLAHTLLILGTAFLTGIALGAMVINYQLLRYAYKLEIIDFALKQKRK